MRRRARKPAAAASPERPATKVEGSGTPLGGGTTITGGGTTGGTTIGGGTNGGGTTGGTTITGGTTVGGTTTEMGGDTGQMGGNNADADDSVSVNDTAVSVAVGNTLVQRQRADMAFSWDSSTPVDGRDTVAARLRDCAGSASSFGSPDHPA